MLLICIRGLGWRLGIMDRAPVVAGQFYPDSAAGCENEILSCLNSAGKLPRLPGHLVGGIVPHAGWVFSGRVAASVFRAISSVETFDTVILFGAAHRWSGSTGAMYSQGCWETPIGRVEVDFGLADAVLKVQSRPAVNRLVVEDESAHAFEHSLEVQMPFIRYLAPDAKILPVMVPPILESPAIGELLSTAVTESGINAVAVGTTDLTHYGPSYGFQPAGRGKDGLKWAKEINDQRMIDKMERMEADQVVPEAARQGNACGAGAVGAAIGFSKAQGADRAVTLEHCTSHEVLAGRGGEDAVGYVGIVFGYD